MGGRFIRMNRKLLRVINGDLLITEQTRINLSHLNIDGGNLTRKKLEDIKANLDHQFRSEIKTIKAAKQRAIEIKKAKEELKRFLNENKQIGNTVMIDE